MGQPIPEKRTRKLLQPVMVGAGVSSLTGLGEVVSCFTGAVNIRRTQGFLVSLIEDPINMTYLSICVPSLFQNQKSSLAPGDRVAFEGRCLVGEDFALELLGQPLWQGTITRKEVKGLEVSKIGLLRQALLLKGKDGGFFGLLGTEKTGNPFVSKARQLLGRGRKAASKATGVDVLCGLVGLGPGSTPSGDDFIAGVLMGEEAKAVAGKGEPVITWPEEREVLTAALDRTNDAGKTLLWQALQGRFPNPLIEAIRAVSEAKGKKEVDAAVERAVSRGATSGTDALVGFLFSMEGRL